MFFFETQCSCVAAASAVFFHRLILASTRSQMNVCLFLFVHECVIRWQHASVIIGIKETCCTVTMVFTALHVMQTRSSDENSVCPSVCLSVCPSVCLSHACIVIKKEERSVQIFISYERTFILVFWEEEWLVGGDPFYLKFWVNRPPLERNRRFSTNNRS